MPDDDRLDVQQVAELTGFAVRTLYTWRSQGVGPVSYRLGGRVYYRREAVETWLAEQEAATARGGAA